MRLSVDKWGGLYFGHNPCSYRATAWPPSLSIPTPGPNHASLVARVAARDRDAFVQLFEIFAPRVKGYLVRGVRDAERADDLTQEVLLRVWRRAHTFDAKRAAVSTWIFTMARSVMIDAIRKLNRPEPNENDDAFVPAAPPPPDRATELIRRQARVRSAMSELPTEQSEILQSAYFEGKSLRVISEEHEVPLGTVKSRVRLAFARLRVALSGEGGG